jgi:A/G-specific adenine glycosylase
MPSPPDPGGVTAARRQALLAWSDGARRDLPWRRTRDPWAVLVSELMLQQTQVSRVVSRWAPFLERFPTPAACAAVPAGEVVRAWHGLGYNRRAVNLHRCAVACTDRHGGRLPTTLPDLLALPGVGAYTARAVLAFAHEAGHGVVDTNAARVLARAVAGRPLRAAPAQALADALVPAGQAWAWNQAMIDLGATVCRKRDPRCEACPWARACEWARAGGEDPAVGSAGVGRSQKSFEGSDRQGRGRLVDAMRAGPVAGDHLAAVAGWPGDPERARRTASALVREGLAEEGADGSLRLP